MNQPDKYLLCRPLGGLNDCLCQVEKCWRIAKRSRRKLVVQTTSGNLDLKHRFDCEFDNVFYFDQFTSSLSLKKFEKITATNLSVYPRIYDPIKNNLDKSLELISNGNALEYRLNDWKNRAEECLVHESTGGGLGSANLLSRLTLKENLFEILSNINILNLSVAIHFRATDYESSFVDLKETISKIDSNKIIYLATDNNEILTKVKQIFYEKKIFQISDVLNPDQLNELSRVEIAILELLVMALCPEMIVLSLVNHSSSWPRYSGFSRLAKHTWSVNKVKQEGLIYWLLSRKRFVGLGGSRNKFFNFFVIALIEIPRIFNQSRNSKGIYKQLDLIYKSQRKV